ncbi:hypothetical protein DPMN_056758 [Dreissena polymorpha]|uniref:Uncharacterized protein n=1 Tax=Dreissena polymorpha TaxID=45954 RepID=A0A9D4CV12_DREPO|nr:hypothetical protein DPMN_056758 [Dreissena polymorpha]
MIDIPNLRELATPHEKEDTARDKLAISDGIFALTLEHLNRHEYFKAVEIATCSIKQTFEQPHVRNAHANLTEYRMYHST